MTDREPWDDERLDAAWSARSTRGLTPSDLPGAVMAQLRSPSRRSTPTWRLLLPIAAAIAIAVVLVRPSPLATPIASSPSTSQPAASQTRPTPSPSTLAGSLPIVTVAELLERSVGEPSSEEVIVRGRILFTREIYDCLQNPNPHPLIPYCRGEDYLTDGPFSVLEDPIPNAIVPIIGPDAHLEISRFGGPSEVLAVGHQRDHRWTTCPTEQQAACKARFVIDRLLPVDAIANAPLEPWSIVDGDPDPVMQLTPDAVISRVEATVGAARVISIGFLSPGSQIRDIEPTAVPNPAVSDQLIRPVWIVRAITSDSGGSLRTFVVSDVQPPEPGTSGISEITETEVIALAPSLDPAQTVFGLPVITVEEAIAIRDAGVDDRVIAVGGWFPPQSAAICLMDEPASPLELGCYDNGRWLATGPEWPARDDDPRFLVDVDEVDRGWIGDVHLRGDPVDVVLVGHFDDPRSLLCPTETSSACRDRFVVDRVESATGFPIEWAISASDQTPMPLIEPIVDAIGRVVPDGVILSMVFVDHATLLADYQRQRGDRQLLNGVASSSISIPADGLWRVKVLDGDRSVRYHVWGAGESYIFRVLNRGGAVRVDQGAIVSRPSPWPPKDATVLTMTSPVGAGRPPVKIAIVDQTGLLTSVTEVASDELKPEIPRFDSGSALVAGDPQDARRMFLVWTGGPCDRLLTVIVEELDSILVNHGPQPDCDATAVGRALLLTFKEPVDPSIFDVSYMAPTLEE